MVQKMRHLFKKQGFTNTCMKVIEVPLTFLRNYSCPMAEHSAWDRTRASVLPMTLTISFFYLSGNLTGDGGWFYLKFGLFAMIPGLILGTAIRLRTKKTQAPEFLMTLFACICFVMSILWIKFSTDCIMDLLKLFGFVTKLPTSLFGLTILAWGNDLGDMSADVAMTKKGFGEMAITGTMAGPIFNVLVGMGLSMTLKFARMKDPFAQSIHIALYTQPPDGGSAALNKVAVLPVALIAAQLTVLLGLLVNALKNKFQVEMKFTVVNCVIYLVVLLALIAYSIVDAVSAPLG